MFSYGGCMCCSSAFVVSRRPTHIIFIEQKNVAKGRLATFRYGFGFV